MTIKEKREALMFAKIDLEYSTETVKKYKKLLAEGKSHPFGEHIDLDLGIKAHRKAMRYHRKLIKELSK